MGSWAFALRRSVPSLMIGFGIAAASTIAAPASPQLVAVNSTENRTLGNILVSASGRTLYHISAEPKNVVRCTGACAADWPPLLIAAGTKPVAGPGVRASLLGTVKRPDGTLQITYGGLPLYRYSGDKRAGSIKGAGVGGIGWLGGAWHAVAPSGAVVTKVNASPTPTVTTTGADETPFPC
jgi:predicted lipoprotein with Yx(FWY)xxD motif